MLHWLEEETLMTSGKNSDDLHVWILNHFHTQFAFSTKDAKWGFGTNSFYQQSTCRILSIFRPVFCAIPAVSQAHLPFPSHTCTSEPYLQFAMPYLQFSEPYLSFPMPYLHFPMPYLLFPSPTSHFFPALPALSRAPPAIPCSVLPLPIPTCHSLFHLCHFPSPPAIPCSIPALPHPHLPFSARGPGRPVRTRPWRGWRRAARPSGTRPPGPSRSAPARRRCRCCAAGPRCQASCNPCFSPWNPAKQTHGTTVSPCFVYSE